MNLPKISVVMPSYNQAKYIEASLRSVLDQGYPNLELIVIDGGSTDCSQEIIERYAARLAHWVSEPDGGQTNGLIKGFKRATGDIECWLNSDDLLRPGSLQEVAAYFQHHPHIDAVYGDSIWISDTGRTLREQREIPFNRFIWMHTYNYIPGMSMFWRRALYERVGGLDPQFDLSMDADLWIRFAEAGRIGHVRRLWSCARFYPEQKNQRLRARSDEEDLLIRERYWGTPSPPLLHAKRAIAQSLRIAWRLTTGCYSQGYRRYLNGA